MIGANTQVVITVGSLLVGLAAVLVVGGGVLWAVLAFTIGGMRDDVKAIRDSVGHLQTADRESVNRAVGIELKLREQVGSLKVDFATLSGKLDNVASKLDSVVTSVNGLSGRIDKFQMDAYYAWNDPKRISELAQALKKEMSS